MLGHKADIGFMALGADLWRLRRLQSELQAAGLIVTSPTCRSPRSPSTRPASPRR